MQIKKFFLALLLLAFLVSAETVLATAHGGGGGSSGGEAKVTGTDIKELGPLIARIIYFLLGIVGAISIILIIIGGMRMMMASGDEKATAAAKNTITFAIIGLVIVLLAVMIVNVLGYLLGAGDLNFVRIGPAT